MKRKLRIFSNIAIICLSICMFAFGVYAASTVSVTTGGTVTFNATGVYAKVERTVSGAKTNPEKAETIINASASDNTSIPMNANLEFEDANTPIEITFTITNMATEKTRDIFVHVAEGTTDPVPTSNNVIKAVEGLNNWFSITANTDATVKILLMVDDANKSANATYNYIISLHNKVTEEGYVTLNAEESYGTNNFDFSDPKGRIDEVNINYFGLNEETVSDPKIIVPSYVGENLVEGISCVTANRSSLTNLVLPNTIKYFGDNCLRDCASLSLTVLPSKLEYITSGAFESTSSSIHIVNLPYSIKQIYSPSFNSGSFTLLSCESPNYTYCMMSLFHGTSMRYISLNDNMTIIEEQSFYYCTELNISKLPANLEIIGDGAFADCNIKTITIPASVETLGDGCFSSCENLKTVTYAETVDKWNTLNLNNKAGFASGVVVTCSDGTVTIGAIA